MVEYTYDAWGKLLSTTGSMASTLGVDNPLRYRGYVYDTETGLYYLQTRYYDPDMGRFICADAVVAGVGGEERGYNLFVYCFNNPINMTDESGNWPKWVEESAGWVATSSVEAAKNVWKFSVITLSKDFRIASRAIIVSNIYADAGICIGIGADVDVGSVSIEAIMRADMVGVQLKDGKIRVGCPGRSAAGVTVNPVTISRPNDTFEGYGHKREESSNPVIDIGLSWGQAQAFAIGYHYSASISLSGIAIDTFNYIKGRW